MSPGSSSHSWLGLKRRSSFSGAPVDWLVVAHATDAPATPALQLQQKHVVGIDVRPDAAAVAGVRDHQVIEPRIGHEAKRRAASGAPRRRTGRRPAPATSSPAAAAAAGCAATAARVARVQRAPMRHDQARFDVGVSRQARTAARASAAGSIGGHAARTSSGLDCQCRRMNCAGDRPPSSRVRCMQIHAALSPAGPPPCGRVVRSSSDGDRRPLRRHADLGPARCAGRVDRRAEGAGGVLLWRRRPAGQGRRGARRARKRASRPRCTWSPSTRSATTTPARCASRTARCFPPI